MTLTANSTALPSGSAPILTVKLPDDIDMGSVGFYDDQIPGSDKGIGVADIKAGVATLTSPTRPLPDGRNMIHASYGGEEGVYAATDSNVITVTVGGPVACVREATPPAPPRGGAVLARPMSADSLDPNVVIIDPQGSWTPDTCGATTTPIVSHPTTIMVGAEGALLLRNTTTGTLSEWGARDVSAKDSAPAIFPGNPGWTPNLVQVVPPREMLFLFNSCRGCSLAGIHFTPVQAMLPKAWAYEGDLSGADLHDARLKGYFKGWNFTGTNLSGADLSAGDTSLADATFDHTDISGATFNGDDLRGTHFLSPQFNDPPSLTNVTTGKFDGACTRFESMDLLPTKLSVATSDGDCTKIPMFVHTKVAISSVASLVRTHARIDLANAEIVSSGTARGDLAGSDLSGTDLSDTSFLGFPPDLSRVDFDNAILAGANLELATLSGATFHDVDAKGASFRGADLNATGSVKPASFAGNTTNLENADFAGTDVSGVNFAGDDLKGAVFTRALAVDTDFDGVAAPNAAFDGAHIYGNGQAFGNATDLDGVDFADALLAGNVDQGGGFNLTKTELKGAKFDGAQCIGCNFTGSKLDQVNFSHAYLPGAVFAGVLSLDGVNLTDAWLFCGDQANSSCRSVSGRSGRWNWPLSLGANEAYGPVPFAATNLKGTSLTDVAACPDGKAGRTTPVGCDGHMQPSPAHAPPLPAPCTAAGTDVCPTPTSILFSGASVGLPLAVTATSPSGWSTRIAFGGYDAAFDDGTIRQIGAGPAKIIAGQAGKHCTDPKAPCGDGAAAARALLGKPAGLAVGLDGSLYIADPVLHRVRRVDPSGQISTVAGDGEDCTTAAGCGDGRAATRAALAGPYGIWIAPDGILYIADGSQGIRVVATDGKISSLDIGGYDIRSVIGDVSGTLYAAASKPDYLIKINLATHAVTKVVGTGTSGYNGNATPLGTLLPGTSVQVNDPQGLALGPDSEIVFADTGNSLIRAYVPSSGHVIDDLAGLVVNGQPQTGSTDAGQWSDRTKLGHPRSVALSPDGLYVIADTDNRRILQFGPAPLTAVNLVRRPETITCVVSTGAGPARVVGRPRPATCGQGRLPEPSRRPRGDLVLATVSRGRSLYASGWRASSLHDRMRLVLTELQRLAPGRYRLVLRRWRGRRMSVMRISIAIGSGSYVPPP